MFIIQDDFTKKNIKLVLYSLVNNKLKMVYTGSSDMLKNDESPHCYNIPSRQRIRHVIYASFKTITDAKRHVCLCDYPFPKLLIFTAAGVICTCVGPKTSPRTSS